MAQNLTSKDIKTWKNSIDKAISTNLVKSLEKAQTAAKKLQTITSSSDENNLSYRFKDLAKLTGEAASKLKACMKQFDASLEEYINTTKKAEDALAEQARKGIDGFAEAANTISKLKT